MTSWPGRAKEKPVVTDYCSIIATRLVSPQTKTQINRTATKSEQARTLYQQQHAGWSGCLLPATAAGFSPAPKSDAVACSRWGVAFACLVDRGDIVETIVHAVTGRRNVYISGLHCRARGLCTSRFEHRPAADCKFKPGGTVESGDGDGRMSRRVTARSPLVSRSQSISASSSACLSWLLSDATSMMITVIPEANLFRLSRKFKPLAGCATMLLTAIRMRQRVDVAASSISFITKELMIFKAAEENDLLHVMMLCLRH